jgi:hypothetical protein
MPAGFRTWGYRCILVILLWTWWLLMIAPGLIGAILGFSFTGNARGLVAGAILGPLATITLLIFGGSAHSQSPDGAIHRFPYCPRLACAVAPCAGTGGEPARRYISCLRPCGFVEPRLCEAKGLIVGY